MDDEAIVFLDDDLGFMRRNFTEPDEAARRDVTDPAMIEAVIRETFEQARELGAYYFGWEGSEQTIRFYSGQRPFALTGMMNGCAMGFRAGHGLRFDERIVAKNDYDVAALNAYRHRICFRDTRYAFAQVATFTGAGGLSHYRNSETEARDCAILREKYGDLFAFGRQGGTRRRDYAGVRKVSLQLPY